MDSIVLMSCSRSINSSLRIPEVKTLAPFTYLMLRPFFYKGQDSRMVPVALPLRLQYLQHLIHDGRNWQRHPVLSARRQSYPQILVVQFYPKAGIEGMIQELLSLGLHNLVPGEPPREYVQDLGRLHPRLRPEHQRLGDRLDGQGDHDLVGRLHDLPRPGRTDVSNSLPHHAEERLRPLE